MVESTLSGGSLGAHLQRARASGYALTLVMVFLDSTELCLHRVAQRVAAGGHDVPEADVRRRFGRSVHQFLHRYRALADDWFVVFNGETGYTTVARGTGTAATIIFDDTLWTRFAQIAEQEAADGHPDSD